MIRPAGVSSPAERGTRDRDAIRPLAACAQCGRTHDDRGRPLSLYPVTRHRSLLRPELTHPLKSWYPVVVCSACIGPAVLEKDVALPNLGKAS